MYFAIILLYSRPKSPAITSGSVSEKCTFAGMAFCVTPPHPMASCIPLKEGASVTGKWKNCNTFLSFCLAILSQIRSRGVASVLCSTMGSIGLLEMVDAPLQKIKKASSHTVFHVISQDTTIFLMKSGSGKAWTQINMAGTVHFI